MLQGNGTVPISSFVDEITSSTWTTLEAESFVAILLREHTCPAMVPLMISKPQWLHVKTGTIVLCLLKQCTASSFFVPALKQHLKHWIDFAWLISFSCSNGFDSLTPLLLLRQMCVESRIWKWHVSHTLVRSFFVSIQCVWVVMGIKLPCFSDQWEKKSFLVLDLKEHFSHWICSGWSWSDTDFC
jgi:hypothetical protein